MLLPLVRRKVGLGCMSGQCTPMMMSWNPLNCCHYIMAFIVKTKTGYCHQIFNLLIKRHVTLFTHYPQFVPLLYNPPSTAGWCNWWWTGPAEPDEDPTCLLENPTPGDILHIHEEDAGRVSGALLNQYNRKLVKVFNLIFFNSSPVAPSHF